MGRFLRLRNGTSVLVFFILLFSLSFFLEGVVQEASFPLPQTIKEAQSALGADGWFTIVIFILTFIALVTEVRPPAIVMLISSGILVIAGILTPKQFLEGFSSEILVTIAMLCIMVRAMEVNGLLEVVAKRILSNSRRIAVQTFSFAFPVSVGSAFINNTPIVLMMTPIIRRWALKKKLFPSKFLIPLSYAALFGGACTLIGTSTNLVVHGLLKSYAHGAGFHFFELGLVGVPCAAVGLLYLAFVCPYLLPERLDPTSQIAEETRAFTAEFIIGKECPVANKTIREAARRYFRGELLIQIDRNNAIIDSPSEDLVLFVGDRLVFAGDIHQIAELHAIKDLESQADPKFKLDVTSSHFSEIVIPTTSLFVGKTLRQINFRNNYGASVLAVYRQGWRVLDNVKNIVLQAGDTLMLISGEPWAGTSYPGREFYYIRHHEKLVVFNPWKAAIVMIAFIGMVVAASFGMNVMVASLAAVFVIALTRSMTIRESQNSIIWNVLLLIACSFSLGRAMQTTGVASYFAEIILKLFGTHPHMLIGGILAVTIVCTEFMTNNATALILFPIAAEAAKLAGYDSIEAVKAVGVAVAIGASCGYAIPTGYQTHMIVFGPGGYKFTDFLKTGIFMDFIIWAIGTALIPKFWALS